MVRFLVWFFSSVIVVGCSQGAHDLSHNGFCFGYQEETSSDYILPYPTGVTYSVIQGNCTGGSHSRDFRYAYDFGMAIGDPIIASRGGTVTAVVESHENFGNQSNLVSIQHSDGTVATYVHINQNSVPFSVGDSVNAGDTIAAAGASGTQGAHLHFSVSSNVQGSDSLPITFSNTRAHPYGLRAYQAYTSD